MSTDLQKTIRFFEELGIGYKQYEWQGKIVIELMVGNTKVEGYNGFHSTYGFDKEGNFIEVVIGE